MARLPFEYFVWIDADTIFIRQPKNLLQALGHAPMHLPLETDLELVPQDAQFGSRTAGEYRHVLQDAGVLNPVYYGESAFWIVHREVVDRVVELATNFLAHSD